MPPTVNLAVIRYHSINESTKPASLPLRQPFTAQHSSIVHGGSWGFIGDWQLILVTFGSANGSTVNAARVPGGRSWIAEAAGIVWRISSFWWCKDIRRSFYDHVFLLSGEELGEYRYVWRKTDMCGDPWKDQECFLLRLYLFLFFSISLV